MSPTTRRTTKKAAAAAAAAESAKRPFVAHLLVPPHELLTEAETAEALATLGVPPERLPKILANDPGLRTDPKAVAAREAREPLAGRLVRVRRPSATAGEAIAYRMLIAELGD
jgi:DNA-directed RNA polymerase subunit H